MKKKTSKLSTSNVIQSGLPLVYLIIALFALRWTFVEPYVVPTGSMEPTLKTGDRLYALKCAYDVRFPFTDWILFRTGKVKRGDVILFKNPQNPSVTFVKRAIGLPGDKIEYRDARLFVNGDEVNREPFPSRNIMYDIEGEGHKTLYLENLTGVRHYAILDNSFDPVRDQQEETMLYRNEVVPPDSLFAVGDNRDNSHDSRAWGFVPMENLKGRAMFIWFSSWDPNIKESNDPIIVRVFTMVGDLFRYTFDLFAGEAHVRTERIGTIIQ